MQAVSRERSKVTPGEVAQSATCQANYLKGIADDSQERLAIHKNRCGILKSIRVNLTAEIYKTLMVGRGNLMCRVKTLLKKP